METIKIRGLRQNNLKNISLDIPKNKIVVFTGVSGSGKSSIVFDTIAAESQRQMNETYSVWIRGRLPRYEKPNDEPTTGLHFADVHKLVEILRRLSDGGNTVVIIEHNLDVIKTADYIIDIGPEGGDKGGTIIAEGTPEEVAKNKKSYTGMYVKKYLK